jgi:cytidylate kinase
MPVITIGRQFGAGGTTVGGMLARRLKIDLLESRIIDEVAHRLQLPKEEVEAEDEHPGSLLGRLLVALGSAST